MARPELPPCPACGIKLPYDRNPYTDEAGKKVRMRKCACGYIRLEREEVTVSESFPEWFKAEKKVLE